MKKALIVSASVFLPLLASAQNITGILTNIIKPLGLIVNTLIPITFALAVLFFFWGIAQYILASGDAAKKEEGRNKMIWGIVALFVMASVWGLVKFLGSNLGITETPAVAVPGITPGSVPTY